MAEINRVPLQPIAVKSRKSFSDQFNVFINKVIFVFVYVHIIIVKVAVLYFRLSR